MRDTGLTLDAELLDAFARLADSVTRSAACAQLAVATGCDDVALFSRDPEIDALLPPLGMPQTLHHPAEWRAFVARCVSEGEARGMLPNAAGLEVPAYGRAHDAQIVIVFTGGAAHSLDAAALNGVIAVLGALFVAEQRADLADVRASLAGQTATRARELTASLQDMQRRLEAALAETVQSRRAALANAEQSARLAEELRLQAAHLEDQATELELLNGELEQRTLEAEEARAAAEAANRAKSDFLATMSHELRTPINAIIGYAELIEMGISGDITPEQARQVERIRASSRHLLTLINDVLDLAKIEAGHLEIRRARCDLRRPVVDALGLVSLQAAENGLLVEEHCAPEKVEFVGDENRVRQIIANLLSNAVKFTPEGGRVTVRCDILRSEESATLPIGPGPWAFVEVADTGIGIPAEEVARVFQPFIQAKMGRDREHGGTGLGLTISRQLARLMGGDLHLTSEFGAGSTFTLYLPTRAVQPRPIDDALRVGALQSTR